MRVSNITVRTWRNLRNLEFEVPPDTTLVALVGENGSGKTNMLELLSFAAGSFGLAPGQRPARRQMPPEGADVRVVMDMGGLEFDPEQFRLHLGGPGTTEYAAERLQQWDKTLELHVFPYVPGDEDRPPWLPAGTAGPVVSAGGTVPEAERITLASALVGYLQAWQEVNHAFLDANRAYRAISVQDAEILEAARRDPTEASVIRHQAMLLSEDQYVEWVRACLGRAQRDALAFTNAHRLASMSGAPGPEYEDPFASYRAAVTAVLPHVTFLRPDQEQKTLRFETAGTEVTYEELSGGEREVAFLLGQLDRFRLRRGLLLLDEPELHLNAELLRRWLTHVRDTVTEGQVWIATHALEAAEVAGDTGTIVLERAADGQVRSAAPLGERPVLQTLAGAVGSPAFSLTRSRFVLIEGDRPGRERERFMSLCPDLDNTFLEVGGTKEVVHKLSVILDFAHETHQIRVGGVVDRDHRDARQRGQLVAEAPVFVLPVFEIENFFLFPPALQVLVQRNNEPSERAAEYLRQASDRFAGRWIAERVAVQRSVDLGKGVRSRSSEFSWTTIEADDTGFINDLVGALPADADMSAEEFERGLTQATERYAAVRATDELWKRCAGKEVLAVVAPLVGAVDAATFEAQVARLYSSEEVTAPPELSELREYVSSVSVAGT